MEVKLTDDSAWLKLHELPKELANHLHSNFSELFAMHPPNRGIVVMHNQNKETYQDYTCKRWFQSYLNTPKRDSDLKTSYMFSGMHPAEQPNLPDEFRRVLDWLNSQSAVKYNQVVANWYLDGSDYIPFHSDYEYNAVPNSCITVVNLTQDDKILRKFVLKPRKPKKPNTCEFPSHSPSTVELDLYHGRVIEMHGNTQKLFRHGVPPIPAKLGNPGPRISLTFRAFN